MRFLKVTLLFFTLLLIYQSNGDFLDVKDAEGSVYLPVSLLREGNLSFTPSEMPFMFQWGLRTAQGTAQGTFRNLDGDVDGVPARTLYARGDLSVLSPNYYIVPSRQSNAEGEKLYVNTFGPGPGLCAVPVMAAARIAGVDLVKQRRALWQLAKLAAALLTVGSALFLFLTVRRFDTIGVRGALCITLAYALGTCVWSLCSQALWQQTANNFFLSIGIYCWIRAEQAAVYSVNRETVWSAALSALAMGCAVACRATSLAPLVVLGLALVRTSRRAGLIYGLTLLVPLLALGAYNFHYLGSPFAFGQAEASRQLALEKTGSPNLWQTPLWIGASGLLFSPSRGLFVFSPFLIFAVMGLTRLREDEWKFLRPLPWAFLPVMLAQFKWYDWWGGWGYGYRPLLDILIPLCLLMLPAWPWLRARRIRTALFGALLGWSVLVQFIGAFAYDPIGWNNRLKFYELRLPGQSAAVKVTDENEARKMVREQNAVVLQEIRLNVDEAENRWRLWSLTDNQIGYYLTHFSSARTEKRARLEVFD